MLGMVVRFGFKVMMVVLGVVVLHTTSYVLFSTVLAGKTRDA